MVNKTIPIWNDNIYTDNFKLYFEELDPLKPEKIILTKSDDDKNNAPHKWEFEIVDKEYVDKNDVKNITNVPNANAHTNTYTLNLKDDREVILPITVSDPLYVNSQLSTINNEITVINDKLVLLENVHEYTQYEMTITDLPPANTWKSVVNVLETNNTITNKHVYAYGVVVNVLETNNTISVNMFVRFFGVKEKGQVLKLDLSGYDLEDKYFHEYDLIFIPIRTMDDMQVNTTADARMYYNVVEQFLYIDLDSVHMSKNLVLESNFTLPKKLREVLKDANISN